MTCADDINEILYFLRMGQEHIERTDVKDIVIVIGPSGVGKSTLTQFVANETNKLRAECDEWEDECWIVDDSGATGDKLISKTFIPNLVFHESTKTPFYDMPGFNDNRNESMEIANAFFMQQILNDAETVKILVLARYSSFDNSARLDFPNLLMNLVDLIKSPAKFKGGMGIISTMAPSHLSHDSIIRRNTRFLKESLLDDIRDLFSGREEYIEGSIEILENWLESDTGNYFDAKFFSYFLTASKRGPLLEDPLLFNNKKFLEEVIWDRLDFVRTDADDFGLVMSGGALRKLEITGSCICNLLVKQMQTFADNLEHYILTNILSLIEGNETDILHLAHLLTNLTNSDFAFDNMDGENLSFYLDKLLSEVVNLRIPSLNQTKQQIEDTLSLIQFIELTKAKIQFDPILWVIDMQPIKGNLIKSLDTPAGLLQNSAILSLADESNIIAEHILTSIASLRDISGKEEMVAVEAVRVKNMFERIRTAQLTTTKLTQFLILYLSEYDQLKQCNNCSSIPQFNALSVLEILSEFSWSSRDWIATSQSYLQNVLELERDLTIFLRAMFKDLDQPIVQTGDDLAIHSWWNNQTQLTKDNFNDFYSIISTQGFNSSRIFDRTHAQNFVFHRTEGRYRLESLLDSMLKNIYDCPNTSEIIIRGAIISFDRVISRCINKQQMTRSSIVLTATYKMYANAKIIGRNINANNNINVILMSPEMIVSNHSKIDLNGGAAQLGEEGKSAGTVYTLVQNVLTTNDGSIPCEVTFPSMIGGQGGDGRNGSTGNGGAKGDRADAFTVDNDCAAWYGCVGCPGGMIQIRGYTGRNTCNSCTTYYKPDFDSDCFCWAPSSGVSIKIIGTRGYTGGNGGNGEDGKCGGAGGQSYFVDANYFQSTKTATTGSQGKSGIGGLGGPGGQGGLYGDTMTVIIYERGAGSRYCGEGSRTFQQSNERGPSGQNGSAGKSCTSVKPVKSVNRAMVTDHFASFKIDMISSSEFLFARAKSFLELLGNAQPLD